MKCPLVRPACLVCLLTFPGVIFCQSHSPSVSTLRTGVQLVVEDVVVTDSHGNPVHGLTQADFTVLENRSQQPLKGFEEHTRSSAAHTAEPLPKGVFSNVPAVKGDSVNVLLLDGLNTPPQAQPYLRDQLVKFLAQEQPGTQTAVFVLNQRLHMLQDFTTDAALLKRVIKMQGVQFSPLLNRELNDTAAHSTSETLSDLIESASSPAVAQTLAGLQQALLDMQARQSSAQTQIRARITMDALSQMARYLAGVPGRKNLLWFSGSFPIVIQRDVQTTGNPFAGQADLSAELTRTVNLLAQNQVAVYPIDARGLEAPPSGVPNENGFQGDLQRTQRTYGTQSATPRDDGFYQDQANEHATMQQVAEGTGGEAFYNTNGLLQATQRATSDGQNYYTPLYTPPPGSTPGAFRPVQVKVDRPGLKLAYRRGYYAQVASDRVAAGASTLSSEAVFGVPDASEIAVRLEPVQVKDAPADKTIGWKASGDTPHSVYALNLQVAVESLNFTQGDDRKMHATLEFATLLYDSKGAIVDSHQDRAVLALDPARYQAMTQGGLRFHHTVALPNEGSGTVRVLVHDVSTNRVGSLHLSNAQIREAAGPAHAAP